VALEHGVIFHQVFSTEGDLGKQDLTRNIDNMLDLVYGPSGAHLKNIASVNAGFNLVNKLGREIETHSIVLMDESRD